jgi:hypothetical protein
MQPGLQTSMPSVPSAPAPSAPSTPSGEGKGAGLHARDLQCGGCGRRYGPAAWAALPAERVLGDEEMRRHLTTGAARAPIVVRRCASCGRAMARFGA